MTKSLYIAEKPSVAQEFANALKKRWRRGDGGGPARGADGGLSV